MTSQVYVSTYHCTFSCWVQLLVRNMIVYLAKCMHFAEMHSFWIAIQSFHIKQCPVSLYTKIQLSIFLVKVGRFCFFLKKKKKKKRFATLVSDYMWKGMFYCISICTHTRPLYCRLLINPSSQRFFTCLSRRKLLVRPGPSCSKLTISLVNVPLKLWSLNMPYTLIFLLKKCE